MPTEVLSKSSFVSSQMSEHKGMNDTSKGRDGRQATCTAPTRPGVPH